MSAVVVGAGIVGSSVAYHLARRGVPVTLLEQGPAPATGVTQDVLDLVHVIEKLWAASRCFHAPADADAEDWIAVKAARILRGSARQAADEIRAEADHHKLTGDQRMAADKSLPIPRQQRRFRPLRPGSRRRLADRQRRHRRRSPPPHRRQTRHYRQQMERPGR
nr:FAD-dependent oxidoreductase [Streptomyces alboflavus]